jgi:ubiquinone/menaquinone biosynthesis C-methylase UbiE
MIEVACVDADDDRLHFVAGAAENLRFSDGVFDLVVAATSFDHWCDQRAGFAECFRVLAPDGALVLTDLFSTLLTPTALFGRAGRARAVARANVLLDSAGFQLPTWQKPVRNLSCLRHAHQDRNGFEMIGGRLSPSVT